MEVSQVLEANLPWKAYRKCPNHIHIQHQDKQQILSRFPSLLRALCLQFPLCSYIWPEAHDLQNLHLHKRCIQSVFQLQLIFKMVLLHFSQALLLLHLRAFTKLEEEDFHWHLLQEGEVVVLSWFFVESHSKPWYHWPEWKLCCLRKASALFQCRIQYPIFRFG